MFHSQTTYINSVVFPARMLGPKVKGHVLYYYIYIP